MMRNELGISSPRSPPPVEPREFSFMQESKPTVELRRLREENESLKRKLAQESSSGIVYNVPTYHMGTNFTLPPNIVYDTSPQIQVMDSDAYPYPKYWVKNYHLRPSVIIMLRNCHQFSQNNLMAVVVPIDAQTKLPLANSKVEVPAEGIDDEVCGEMQAKYGMPAIRFNDLKIKGDRTLSNKNGNEILLGFCVYSKHSFPPTLLTQTIYPKKIRVFNRFNELPAPEVIWVLPNRVRCGEVQELKVYGQLFKKGKSGTTCGITSTQLPPLTQSSLADSFEPFKVPPDQAIPVNSNSHMFQLPLSSPTEGFAQIVASNDQVRYGVGKLIYFEQEPPPLSPEAMFFGDFTDSNDSDYTSGSDTKEGSKKSKSGGGFGGFGGGSGGNGDTGAFYGQMHQLQNFLAQGGDINLANKQGMTSLMWASWIGRKEMVEFLLSNGADVDIKDHLKETALHLACRGGHTDIIQLLLAHNANVNEQNVEKTTPFQLAISGGHLAAVEILRNHVEDLEYKDINSFTALHYAAVSGNTEIAELLIDLLVEQGLQVDMQDCTGFTPLHWASALNNETLARILIDNKADVNITDVQNETPLFLATRNSNTGIIRALLDSGAKKDIRNLSGRTPVDYAQIDQIKDALYVPKTNHQFVNPIVFVNASRQSTSNEEKLKKEYNTLANEVEELKKRLSQMAVSQMGTPVSEKKSQVSVAQPFVVQQSVAQPPIPKITVSAIPVVKPPTITISVPAQASISAPISAPVSISTQVPASASVSISAPIPDPSSLQVTTAERKSSYSESEGEEVEEDVEDEEFDLFDLKLKGKEGKIGQLKLPREALLSQARQAIESDTKYPKKFAFWFDKMQSIIEEFQENQMKASMCGNTLIIKEDTFMKDTSEETLAEDWWHSKYKSDSLVPLDTFYEWIQKSFPPQEKVEKNLVEEGLRDFFGTICVKKQAITLADLQLFLRLFGPIKKFQQKLNNVYREPYFHGFISFDESQQILKGKPDAFLIRYSQSLIHKGCFVLNVNKGKQGDNTSDKVENYAVRYITKDEIFVFWNKPYGSLKEFVTDTVYEKVLKTPMLKKNPAPQPEELRGSFELSTKGDIKL